jgi:hypothetical protein
VLEPTATFGLSDKKRKFLEDTLFINGTVNLGTNKIVELLPLRLLLMATLGLSQTRDKSGELLAASGRTLLDVLERLQSALMELPTSLDALRLDQVLAIFTNTSIKLTPSRS